MVPATAVCLLSTEYALRNAHICVFEAGKCANKASCKLEYNNHPILPVKCYMTCLTCKLLQEPHQRKRRRVRPQEIAMKCRIPTGDGYECGRVIGSGSFATVYSCTTDNSVVIKKLDRGGSGWGDKGNKQASTSPPCMGEIGRVVPRDIACRSTFAGVQ